jgi:hypothetical protein
MYLKYFDRQRKKSIILAIDQNGASIHKKITANLNGIFMPGVLCSRCFATKQPPLSNKNENSRQQEVRFG